MTEKKCLFTVILLTEFEAWPVEMSLLLFNQEFNISILC